MSDPGIGYRTKDEVEKEKKTTDCITHVKNLILDNKFGDEASIKLIEKEVRKEVDEVAEKCLKADRPTEDQLYNHILTDNTTGFIRNTTFETSRTNKV